MSKKRIAELALFGGTPAFATVRSTSNLVTPDLNRYLGYAKTFYAWSGAEDRGPLVQELENRLAALHHTRFCITFCSGFMALMLAMAVLCRKDKSEVIMPSLTYRRMSDIAAWVGLVPHFCDVDAHSLAMTAQTVAPCINDQTAFILGVHPMVHLCDIQGLEELAENRGLAVMFDAVEAGCACYREKTVGSFGTAEIFSIHASKLINGFEGGYLTSNQEEFVEKIRRILACDFHYGHHAAHIGLPAALNELHAAMALAALDDLDHQLTRNKERYEAYRGHLATIEGLDVVSYDSKENRSYKNVLIRLNERWPVPRELTLRILHAENMLARPYYHQPLHTKATEYPTRLAAPLPNTDRLCQNYLMLPCGDFVSLEDIQIISDLLAFLQENGDKMSKQFQKGTAS